MTKGNGAATPKKTAALKPAWEPGQSGNPKGRPKGSRNRLGEEFISALCSDFEKHGAAVIAQVREEEPGTYLRVIARVVPAELNINPSNPLEAWSEEKLERMLTHVRELAALRQIGATH